MRHFFLLFFILLFAGYFAQAQDDTVAVKKQFGAVKISQSMHIDGVDSEPEWPQSQVLTDFIQWQGDVGKAATSKTEVRIVYSNQAIFLFAKIYDARADVRKEMGERDELGNADFFGFLLDPFLSEINAFEFIVSAAGTQFDAKISQNGEDNDWDAVWDSEVVISDDFWTVEVKIPYSAIRFPAKDIQTWGINFFRRIQRNKEKCSWNPVNPNVNGFVNQMGLMTGIQSIDAPVRLSATPFVTGGIQTSKNGTSYSYGGGGDIKLGLSNAFTLDMTVIPDFSQTKSDENILNISPFETYYSERRPFFTEGTELFEKGNIVYTRRIGGQPYHFWEAYGSSQLVQKNPDRTQLINAVKVSGRTDKKLGVGLMNAVVGRSYATLSDGSSFLTNPLTNYNVLVLDQQLKNNSSVAIVNTNVFREGADNDANVTAVDFDLNTKSKKWGIGGNAAVSQIFSPEKETTLGHKLQFNLGRRSGKLNYWAGYEEVSDKYNQNDFGYLQRNNSREVFWGASFRRNKPTTHLRNYRLYLNMGVERLYEPNVFTEFWSNLNFRLTTKKFITHGVGMYSQPVHGNDYYESRQEGRYYVTPRVFNIWYFISTDYNKKLAFDGDVSYGIRDGVGANRQGFSLSFRYRFSDRLSTRVSNNFSKSYFVGYIGKQPSSVGYQEIGDDDIIFGLRNRETDVSSFSISYKMSTDMTFSFYARNYWTKINTKDYYLLAENGLLDETPYTGKNNSGTELHNQTYDFFNIDFVYRWHFSPGSDLYLTWKNIAFGGADKLDQIGPSFSGALENPENAVTLKVLYYIDFSSMVRKK